jgi:hypothetical protein
MYYVRRSYGKGGVLWPTAYVAGRFLLERGAIRKSTAKVRNGMALLIKTISFVAYVGSRD